MMDRKIEKWRGEMATSRHAAVQCRNARLV
jgi:hypothetical protein